VFSSETAGWGADPGNSCLRRDQTFIPTLAPSSARAVLVP
jgi:hypothetical protein